MNPSRYRLRRHSELQRVRSLAGVAARERLRAASVQAAECVGTITFEGPLFGGRHEMRCLFSETYSDRYLMIEIDGAASKARTMRGVLRLLSKRLMAGKESYAERDLAGVP